MNGNSKEENVNKQDKEMYQLYEKGLPLLIRGMTEFHLLSEYGDTLLAAKQHNNGKLKFVTWEYDYDRSGVHYGNYFGNNYEAAKMDFTVRSGLMGRNRVLTGGELAVLYDSCVYRGRNDDSITCDDERKLRSVMEMLEDILPEHGQVRGQNQEPDQGDGYGI